MKKLLFTLTICFTCITTTAQVGIGTNTPVTDLDVESRATLAAGEHNGVLIPRVTTIPAVIAPAGTLIYVTGGATPGFYFSNGTAYINVTDTLTATGPFFESGTTTIASNNTQNIFRTGQSSLGEDLAGSQLHVGSTAIVGSPRTTVGIRNLNSSTANAATYGIDLLNSSLTTNNKIGVNVNVTGAGNGDHYGLRNTVTPATSANTDSYGIFSDLGATSTVSTNSYGVFSEVGSGASRGVKYGVYAHAMNNGNEASYSGWFQGDRFAIRDEAGTDGYDLPTVDGTAGQVLSTDGAGNASWQNAANSVPVQYSLWQGGDYNVNNILTYSDLNGIQTILDPSQIDSSNNVEIKLVIWVTDYASQTDFELQAFDINRNASIAIQQADLIYENNASGGFITTDWIDYNAGTASAGNNNTFVQLILRGLIAPNGGGFNPDAQIRSVYVLIRPNQ